MSKWKRINKSDRNLSKGVESIHLFLPEFLKKIGITMEDYSRIQTAKNEEYFKILKLIISKENNKIIKADGRKISKTECDGTEDQGSKK